MSRYSVAPKAYAQIADIYSFTRNRWGEAQANEYVGGLFRLFAELGGGKIAVRRLPEHIQVDAVFSVYGSHNVYWRRSSSKDKVIVVAVLHQRMDQVSRLLESMREQIG